jgi:hypothetical protein
MKSINLTIFVVIIFLFVGNSMYSQQNAVTDNGKKVILKNDGTWEYAKEETTKSSSLNFRKTKWGMSKKEVKKTETGKIVRDDEKVLVYNGIVSNIDALIVYIFASDKLVRAKYMFTPKHTNKNDYLIDYDNVKETLTKKYGSPQPDDSYWRNELYKDDYSEWGFAVSLGHLTYSSEWETENTKILLMLSGENYDIDLNAEYSSKALKYLEEQEKEKKKINEY